MFQLMLLLVVCAGDHPEKPKADEGAEIPKHVRRYFERSDRMRETTQSELRKQLEELTVKIKSASADSRAEFTQQRIQVEKALRGLNTNTVRSWLPADAEVGDIGSLNTGTVRAVFDKRTMAVDFVVGKGDRLEPEFGVIVKGGGASITMKAIIQRWSTTGYVAEKQIPEEELFRVISLDPDRTRLKLGFGTDVPKGEAFELERIPRGEVMKWRAQYEKEVTSLEKQEKAPNLDGPMPERKQQQEPVELPKSVAKWRDQSVANHTAAIDKLMGELDLAREAQAKAKKAAEKKEFAMRVKVLESDLEKAKKAGPLYSMSYMPDQPDVGDLGYLNTAVVVEVRDDSSAIVKRPETLTIVGPERRGTAVQYYSVLITGVNTTDWPRGRAVEIQGFFEASHVDKATRLIVLKPFDYQKWKGVLQDQFGGVVSLRLELTDFKKWEASLEEKPKEKPAQ